MAIGMTAAMVIEQIYRELEVDLTDANRYYTGDFTMKHLATAWLVAATQVQKLVRRSDIQNFIVYSSALTIDSNLQVSKPSEFYMAISAYVGTTPVIISPPGELLDRAYWNSSSGAVGITMTESGSKLQLRGAVTSADTLLICYQRRMHPPASVQILDYAAASNTVSGNGGDDVAYRANVYEGGELFYMATTYVNKHISGSSVGGLTLSAVAGFTYNSGVNESVIFALPELPVDYVDPMIALACLYLMGGEDLNGWRERSQMLSAMPRLHRPSTPRAHTRGLFDADSR